MLSVFVTCVIGMDLESMDGYTTGKENITIKEFSETEDPSTANSQSQVRENLSIILTFVLINIRGLIKKSCHTSWE